MKKLLKWIISITGFILALFILVVILAAVNLDFRLSLAKSAYSMHPTSRNLAVYCNSLLYTDKESEKNEYFGLLLVDNPSNFSAIEELVTNHRITQNQFEISTANEAYDTFLVEYLNSFLKLGKFEQFKETFILDFHKSKNIGYLYSYWETLIENPIKNEQLDTLMSSLKDEYLQINNSNYAAILGNLYLQKSIYTLQENSSEVLELESTIQGIYESWHKANDK